MDKSQSGGLGSMGGMGIGAVLGGPMGASVGSMLGGQIGGMFGDSGGPNMQGMQDIITQRNNQIEEFRQQLETARNNVLNNYQNLQTNTMNRFMPQFEASLAGRGLHASGGAFGSGVGMKAGELQGGYDSMNATMTHDDLNTIGNMKAGMFAPQMDLAGSMAGAKYQSNLAGQQNMGRMMGAGMSMLGGSGMGGSLIGRGIFGGQAPSSQPGYESFNNYNNRLTGKNDF